MFFGLIKTKKDKKIEELQTELDRLRTCLLPTKFECRNLNVETYLADFMIPFEQQDLIPDGYVNRVLTNKMLEVVEKNIVVEHTDDYQRCCTYYRAKLKVVIDK